MTRSRSCRRGVAALAAALLAGGLTAWVTRPAAPAPSAAADFTITDSDGVGTREAAGRAALRREAARHDEHDEHGRVDHDKDDHDKDDHDNDDHVKEATSSPLTPDRVPTRSAALLGTSASRAAKPTRLEIGSIGVDMPVVPVGVDEQDAMALPPDPDIAGWYRYGPAPGTPRGAVVLAAHVDTASEGLGPLAALASTQAGATVDVLAGGSVWPYRVVSVSRVDKTDIDLGRVFSRTGPGRLHLLTCGGDFHPETGYEDNVVLVAEPDW